MRDFGTNNREAFLRKIILDGQVVKLEMPELKEILSLTRRVSANVNQLAKRANETGLVYDADIRGVERQQEEIWDKLDELIRRLSRVK